MCQHPKHAKFSLPAGDISASTLLGYAFYMFVETYGSMIPALFWSIAADTTAPDSAKKGFSFIVAIGQFGGIVGPFFIASLPRRLGLQTSALSCLFAQLLLAFQCSFCVDFLPKPRHHCLLHSMVKMNTKKKQTRAGIF